MTRQFREVAPLNRSRLPKRYPRPEIVVVCEGRVTEPRYFYDFSSLHGNSLVTITSIGGCGVPPSVVDRAIKERKARLIQARRSKDSFDTQFEVWAVFDRDAHPKNQVPEALLLAEKEGIRVAYSNPCFEVWGLMHFSECSKPGHHHETQKALKLALPSFCHETNPIFDVVTLRQKYDDAVVNSKAAAIAREREGTSINGDPSTNVFMLTERIIMFSKRAGRRTSVA